MNRLNEACIYVYGKPVGRNKRFRRRPSEKKFPFTGTPMAIIDRPTMTNAPLLNMMNKACEYKDPSVENIPIDLNKGERQFIVGPWKDRFTYSDTIPEGDSTSESPSPNCLERTTTSSDPERGAQSPLDSKRLISEKKRGFQSPFDSKRMTSEPKRGFQSPFDFKRMTSEPNRGIENSEQRPVTLPDTDFVVAPATPRTRDTRLPSKLPRLTPDKKPKRARRQSPMRPVGQAKVEPFLRRRQATHSPETKSHGKTISYSPASHRLEKADNDADLNVVTDDSKNVDVEYHTADTSDVGTSRRPSPLQLEEPTPKRPMHPLILPNSPHLLKQLATLDGVTSMAFELPLPPTPPVREVSLRTRQCQATPLPSHDVLTNEIQKPRVDQYKSYSNVKAVQKEDKVETKPVLTATNQTQYGNGVLPVNPLDDVREYWTGNKTLKELLAPKFIQISDAPRLKVIAEKFIRYKKDNVEIRKIQEKVVCLEYDIYNENHYKAPAEVMRAYFSIKMPCPTCEEENSMLKEIPSHIRNKFHINNAEITKSAVKQIEVIDDTIDNNKTYLEDLKMVLTRQKIMNEKRLKSSLDLLSMYEMAKKECPPFDYEFSSTNLLSQAELNELKTLILQKCDSCNGVNRTGMRVSTSLRSESVMYDLLRSGMQLDRNVVPDLYKSFWNNQ